MKMKVMIDTQAYQVEIEDIHARPVIAVVEGERYEVWPEDESEKKSLTAAGAPEISVPEAQQAPKMGAGPGVQGGTGKEILSPLPGVIVAILVKPGDKVEHGQELCTLEAMKMKNAIRSNREGTIASIEVNVGDQVNHGQVLLTFES
jgi:biotin carboxyl carrier protein